MKASTFLFMIFSHLRELKLFSFFFKSNLEYGNKMPLCCETRLFAAEVSDAALLSLDLTDLIT